MKYSSYTELGFQINNLRFAVRILSVKVRRPRFWRKKMSVNDGENIISSPSSSSSTSISPTTSEFSSPTPSSDDWIAQFHACYNPIHTEPTTTNTMMSDIQPPINTSTPVPFNTLPLNREQSRTVLHDQTLASSDFFKWASKGFFVSPNFATSLSYFNWGNINSSELDLFTTSNL